MKIKKFVTGELESNSYLIIKDKEAVLFDIGSDDIDEIKAYLNENKLVLSKLILTHGHIDHIKGLGALLDLYKELEVYIGFEDKEFLTDSALNLSKFVYYRNISFHCGDRLKTLNENDEVFNFKVYSTPGHTVGSKCFYNEENGYLITGDTLFKGSMGRTDFPTGNFTAMLESLKKIFNKFPSETVVYPGHGEATKIGKERQNFNF